MDSINISIADDQLLFRQGIASLIKDIPGFQLLFEAGNGAEFLNRLKEPGPAPHVALLDIEMPEMDGVALNDRLHTHYPGIKVLMLSVHSSPRLIARMIQSGASGYLFKNCDKEELITAIHSVCNTGFYLNAGTLRAMQEISSSRKSLKNINGIDIDLSEREKEVLQLICKELTNAEIAEQLYISPRTVDGHRNNLLAKTGCRNTAGLVLFAIRHHIFELHY